MTAISLSGITPYDDTTADAHRHRILPILLLVVGLLFPTSIGGNIVPSLTVVHGALFTAVALWVGLTRGALGTTLQIWNALFIVVWLFAASLVSPFQELAVGALAAYVPIAALYALDLRRLHAVDLAPVLAAATVFVLAAGILVVTGNPAIDRILTRDYAFAYVDLVPNMVTLRKPVFSFGSHSIAAFFYFLLCYLNLETFRVRRRLLHLVLALGCIGIGCFLTSVTAGVMMAWALALVFVAAKGRRLLLAGLLGLGALGVLLFVRQRLGDLRLAADLLTAFASPTNGLLGRYSGGASLLRNVDQLMSQPFRPVGLTFSPTLFYGDSGPLEYLTRGSVPLLLSMYLGLSAMLWRGLRVRRHAMLLFAATMAFELGYSALAYHRYVYLLPFAVMYLNQLDFGSGTATNGAMVDSAPGVVAS